MLQVGVDVMKQYSHMSRTDLINSLAKAEQQLGTQLGELKAAKLSQAECQLDLAQTKIAYLSHAGQGASGNAAAHFEEAGCQQSNPAPSGGSSNRAGND